MAEQQRSIIDNTENILLAIDTKIIPTVAPEQTSHPASDRVIAIKDRARHAVMFHSSDSLGWVRRKSRASSTLYSISF